MHSLRMLSKNRHKPRRQPAAAAATRLKCHIITLLLFLSINTATATTTTTTPYFHHASSFASTAAFIHSSSSTRSSGVSWSSRQQHGGVISWAHSTVSRLSALQNTINKNGSSSSNAHTKGNNNKQVHGRRPRPPKRQPQHQQQQEQQPTNIKSPSSSSIQNNNEKTRRRVLKVPNLETQLQYSRNGHCVLRQHLLPSQIQALKHEVIEYTQRDEIAIQAWKQKVQVISSSKSLAEKCQTIQECQDVLQRFGFNTESASSLPFLQYFNTWRHIPLVLDIVKSLAETASILMDCPRIRLYQDSLFWKRIHDGPTPWHVDARMAPFDTSHFITFWIPLQDIFSSCENGGGDGSALIFCSKSHNDFALPFWNDYQQRTVDTKSPWNHLEERYGNNADDNADDHHLVDYMPLIMGDVTVHDGWTLHCADPITATRTTNNGKKKQQHNNNNNNSNDRMALAISFVDARAVIRGDIKSNNNKADNEDSWSYRDWIDEVPVRIPYFQHDLVPIVYPPKKLMN